MGAKQEKMYETCNMLMPVGRIGEYTFQREGDSICIYHGTCLDLSLTKDEILFGSSSNEVHYERIKALLKSHTDRIYAFLGSKLAYDDGDHSIMSRIISFM